MGEKNKYIVNSKNLEEPQVVNMIVEFKYSKNNKTFNECMINILKKKIKV